MSMSNMSAGSAAPVIDPVGPDSDAHILFRRLSDAAAPFVPHDAAALHLEETADRASDLPSPWHGGEFQSGIKVPVESRGVIFGWAAWLSRTTRHYDPHHLAILKAAADHVGLHILGARHAAEAATERARTATLAASDELLRELTAVLDVRGLFPRISAITQKVLPHDLMTMTFHGDGFVALEASSCEPPLFKRITVAPEQLAKPVVVFPDLSVAALERAGHSPREACEFLAATGYGSFLAVNLRAREQRLGLEFWSRHRGAFSEEDIPAAKRIADHIALAVSHEQLVDAALEVAVVQTRARQLAARVKSLSAELESRSGFANVVGDSYAWRTVLRSVIQVATTDTTVLLTGESGTGKEVVARLLHHRSARPEGPFVAVNCAALPEQLLESELFGYERGAFTGAQQAKPGQIELAAGGVLFLDEVSEMSLSAQAKFLRFLEAREFQRLGGTRTMRANVRVVAASNCDLQRAIEQGRFRRDLFYRLRVFDIRLPALRERRDDILPLAEAFLSEMSSRHGRPPAALSAVAQRRLLDHPWPGNVRELRNAIERAAILADGSLVGPEHLCLDAREPGDGDDSTDLTHVERRMIARVLKETGGNKSQAARRLGLTRMQLYVRLRRYELN